MKRLLVTGADGFIGKYCLQQLQESEYEIHCLSRQLKNQSHQQEFRAGRIPIWHRFDLLQDDLGAWIENVRPTHILHLAWCTDHGKFWSDSSNNVWLEKSVQLLDHFCKNGGERFIFAGTCAEYNWANDLCIEGASFEAPNTLYGQSKLLFTRELQKRSAVIEVATGRIFSLYGPGESTQRFVPSLIINLQDGRTIRMTDGQQWRDYLHVQDVAQAMVALLNSRVQGIVNIASGTPIQLKQIAEQVCEFVGVSTDLIQLGTLARSQGDVDKILASIKRLNNEVKWQPKISLQQGLKNTIEFFQKNK